MKAWISIHCDVEVCNKDDSIEVELPYIPSIGSTLFLTAEQDEELKSKIKDQARFFPSAVKGESKYRMNNSRPGQKVVVSPEDIHIEECLWVKTVHLDLRSGDTFIELTDESPWHHYEHRMIVSK